MSKIMFEIKYKIIPEKREDYLNTILQMRKLIRESYQCQYFIFEEKKYPNTFSEVFLCENQDQFDSLEDNQTDEIFDLTNKIYDEYIIDRKVTYSTKYEI